MILLATLAYPPAMYWGLRHIEPRWMALLLVSVALARLIATREAFWLAVSGGSALLAGVSLLGNAALPLKLYPVLVNAVLLAVFALSLVRPPTAVERLARLREPDLSPAGVAYTRKVTWVWCGFFIVNAVIALATALWGTTATWALYNGLIVYGLIGALFAGEWLVRQRLLRQLEASEVHG